MKAKQGLSDFGKQRRWSGGHYGWPKNILYWKGIQESNVDICATVPIHFVIADGIVAVEGDGPLTALLVLWGRSCRGRLGGGRRYPCLPDGIRTKSNRSHS